MKRSLRLPSVLLLSMAFLLSSPTAKAQELTAMSYNIRYDNPADGRDSWDQRKEFLIAQIAYHAPDVVGTQEGLLHQLRDMEVALEGYAFFGKGRDQGDEQGEHTAVFYNTGQLELLEEETFWLSETPEVPSKGWDAALNRVCTYGRFRHRASGREFYLFNTHFDHVGEAARRESVSLILRQMARVNAAELPVVLMGDLNLEPDSAPIRQLADSMDDAFDQSGQAAYGPPGTFNGFDCTQPVTRRIDYIFTGPGDFTVRSHAILSEFTGLGFPSDHFPVLARLEFSE